MKSILKLKKIKENVIGFDTIEILAFNYDGKGTALTICYGKGIKKHLSSYSGVDLDEVLSEENYRPI